MRQGLEVYLSAVEVARGNHVLQRRWLRLALRRRMGIVGVVVTCGLELLLLGGILLWGKGDERPFLLDGWA